jgi:hypothetical protein
LDWDPGSLAEQHRILKKFKKHEESPKYQAHIQRELDRTRFIVDPVTIDSVDFKVPVKLPLVHRHIWDWQPIPTKVSGEQLKAAYIKWHLRRRIDERLAAGGYHKWQKNWEYFCPLHGASIGWHQALHQAFLLGLVARP